MIKYILKRVADDSLSPEEAEKQLGKFPYEDIGFAKLDVPSRICRQTMKSRSSMYGANT